MDIDLVKVHGNPTSMQHAILRELEQHMGDDVVVVSPNNVASFMINMFSELSGRNISHIVSALNEESPKRVATQKQLYKHLSDYDYVDLFSTPASTYLSMNILLDQLRDQAPYIEDTNVYRQLIVPRNTKFFIGGHTFSTYYPINITYNTKNRMVAAWFDNETHKNPLYELANDSLETVVFNMRGVDIVSTKFPVHQFNTTIEHETLMPSIPFSKIYSYEDKFYAVRVFTNKTYSSSTAFVDRVPIGATDQGNGNYDTIYEDWTELHQTLDGKMYDPDIYSIPTVIVGLDQEFKQVSITIPFIFISQNMLGDKLRVELYTTSGNIDIDGTQLKQSEIPIGVNLTGIATVDKYSLIFTRDTELSVSLIDPAICGGTDGLDFEQIRERVVYNTFVDKLLVTPLDLEAFFGDNGYRVSRFKDGITRRIYTCHKELRDSTGAVVPSGELKTIIDYDHHRNADDANNKTSSIIMFNNGSSFMILPNSLFKYDKELNIAHPLTDSERESIFSGSTDEIISRFNENTYTFTPFHVMLTINNGVPISSAYDFQFPSISVTDFKNEIVDGAMPGLAIVDSNISYDNDTESYEIIIDVSLSISNPPTGYDPSIHVKPVLTTVDKYGSNRFCIGTYVSSVGQGVYQYKFNLGVTFKLDNEYIDTVFGENTNNGILEKGMIPFDPVLNIGLFSDNAELTTSETIDYPIDGAIISDNAVIVSRYEMRTTICRKLDYLFNPVDIIYSDRVFDTWTENIFAKYTDYIFETDQDNIVIVDPSTNLPVVAEGKRKGDYILSDPELIKFETENLELHMGNVNLGIPADIVVDINGITLYEITETSMPTDGEYVYMRHKILEHAKGDPIINLDDESVKRDTKFRVSLTHINRRSSLYDEVVTSYSPYIDIHDYEQMVRSAIKKHADIVSTVKDRLLPNTEIYYTPFRSIGTALFRASSVLTRAHDLEVGISMTLHVIRRVIMDRTTQDTIRNRIITILDNMLTNKIFSLTEVADAIITDMSDLIVAVDVNGIDGAENIQTMMHIEDGTVLNLKHRIDIIENGRLELNRDLNLRFMLAE